MTQDFNTSWFDLRKYSGLEGLDLKGWHRQVSLRYCMQTMDGVFSAYENQIKEDPIFSPYSDDSQFGLWRARAERYPFETYSVQSLTAFDCFCLANEEKLGDIWKACPAYDEMKATEKQINLVETPLDLLFKQAGFFEDGMARLTIDLNATDEQIVSDFRHWLTEYRKSTGIKAPTNNFTEKHFKEWQQWRVLPYIDLVMMAKAEGKSLTQARIAGLIFPDERDIDIVDRVRRTTKPKAEWLVTEATCNAMEAQLQAESLLPPPSTSA
jgi:hypothetical protein